MGKAQGVQLLYPTLAGARDRFVGYARRGLALCPAASVQVLDLQGHRFLAYARLYM
jgi:hypothetical protein